MITLAHDCALMGIHVDFSTLFYGSDPDYVVALNAVVDRVHASRKRSQPASS